MQSYFRINRFFTASLVAALIAGCQPPLQEQPQEEADPVSEQFVRANQYMYRRHQDHIEAFIERVGWEATSTPTGLWIVIEEPGSGEYIKKDSRVTYTFHSSLLDGTPCYEATEQNPKVITIGRGGVESGVEEGMQLMRPGSKAILIIPPHLAHGNFGDREKIPGNTVILYHVKVLEVG